MRITLFFLWFTILLGLCSCSDVVSKEAKESSKSNFCQELNFITNEYIGKFYLHNDSVYIDSALIEINRNVCKCDLLNFKVLTLRKLSLLAIKQDFTAALTTIEELDSRFFSHTYITRSFLKNRFLAMSSVAGNNTEGRDYHLKLCLTELSEMMRIYRFRIFLISNRTCVQDILNDPLSLLLTRYYYYRSISEGRKIVTDELNQRVSTGELNSEFCKTILICIQQDFMEFNGI